MFKLSEVLSALKLCSKMENDDTECEMQDEVIKILNYRSVQHLESHLKELSSNDIKKFRIFSKDVMQVICSVRYPTYSDRGYYELVAHSKKHYSYFSEWVGWDNEGNSVSIPSEVDGQKALQTARSYSTEPVFLIETAKELLCWQLKWQGRAVILDELVAKYFKRFFDKSQVSETPPMDKVSVKEAKKMEKLLNNK